MAKFEKLKLPSYGQMPGVAFHCSDMQMSSSGPRVLIFGGQRQGISGALYSFEQSSGDGFLLMPDGIEGSGPPPAQRTQSTLTSVGEEPQEVLLLFAGFVLNVGCVNDLWKVTISLDLASMPVPSWEQLEPSGTPPEPRYGHSATLLKGGLIAVIGGQDTVIQFNDVHLLTADGSAWSKPEISGTPPSVRMRHTANAVGPSQVLIFGGFNKTDRVLSDCFRLELSGKDSGSWTTCYPEAPAGSKSIPPRAQHAASCTNDNKFLFIFGGYDGAKPLNDLWLLDINAMALKNVGVEPPAPEPRSRHSMHMIGDSLHVFAGYDGSKPVAGDVYTLDCSDPGGMEGTEAGGGDGKKEEKKKADDDDED